MRRIVWGALALLVVLSGCAPSSPALSGSIPAATRAPAIAPEASASRTSPSASSAPNTPTPTPTQSFFDLPVADPVENPPYSRAAFGDAWEDVDGNGCDTRNDILRRDLVDIVYRSNDLGCTVITGTLVDPYTGQTISFVRGRSTSMAVQIDHIVPLAYAWRQGAYTWTDAEREKFANDPLNLVAVDGPANSSKSDKGPSEWTPPNSTFYCHYLDDFVDVVTEYQLTVAPADYRVLQSAAQACGW